MGRSFIEGVAFIPVLCYSGSENIYRIANYNMINLVHSIPENAFLACSGGIDSMVLLDFMLNARKRFSIIHIDHGTEHALKAKEFVQEQCHKLKLPAIFFTIRPYSKSDLSKEEYWSIERRKVFEALGSPVLTAHQLNDAMEWWLFSSIHGEPKLIPVRNKNVIRPMLATKREDIASWARRKGVKWIEDPSNKDTKYIRNLIRHELLPKALRVNPGLATVIRKKYDRA